MRVKIQYKKHAFYGGVIGSTPSGKLVVNLDGQSGGLIDRYRKINEVIIIRNGKLIKKLEDLIKPKIK